MVGGIRPITALEAVWDGDVLVVRTPVRAIKRRGTVNVTLAPVVAGLVIPFALSFGADGEPIFWVWICLFAFVLLANTISGIYFLTLAERLSSRSSWTFRALPEPSHGARFRATARNGKADLWLPAGCRVVAAPGFLPAMHRLLLQDASGRTLGVLSPRVQEYYRAEWAPIVDQINRLLAGQPNQSSPGAILESPPSPWTAGTPPQAGTTPGERSLAMLCYLPVQGIFLLASVGCLVASKSRYARSAAKQSLLHFVFSLLVLSGILIVFGLPTALVPDERVKGLLAIWLTLALVGFAVWNLTAHVYACIRFYRGRPWVMPWLRPIARRWFSG